jgi:hypothetical protein
LGGCTVELEVDDEDEDKEEDDNCRVAALASPETAVSLSRLLVLRFFVAGGSSTVAPLSPSGI